MDRLIVFFKVHDFSIYEDPTIKMATSMTKVNKTYNHALKDKNV